MWNQGGRVRVCWVQSTQQPTVQHPDVPVNRLCVTVETEAGQLLGTQAQLGEAA